MNDFPRLFAKSGLSLERLRSFLLVAEAGNLAKAARGDATRQSQFSRQVKDLEGFFGAQLTRRVGRRIRITDEGLRLAALIRRHLGELDDFLAALHHHPVNVRLGSTGSVLDWIVTPRLAACRQALGKVIIELEPLRSADVVRGVADGRLDFGIVRDDAAPAGRKRWRLGKIGYALFAPKRACKAGVTAEMLLEQMATGELLPGGRFSDRWHEWLRARHLAPQVVVRAASFAQLARLVRSHGIAAALPEIAGGDFDPKQTACQPLPGLPQRTLVLLANARSAARAGLRDDAAGTLAKVLEWPSRTT